MSDTNWPEVLKAYPENDDMIQLYEEWGGSGYLKEVFGVLNEYNPEWNKEKELGGWAAEFILDMLEEAEEELKTRSEEERRELFNEMLDDRYEDFRSGHQFARVNNVAIKAESGEQPCDDISGYILSEGEKTGFPIF